MNQVALIGNITRDIEIKYSQSGAAMGNFGIAVNKSVKQQDGSYQDKAMFFDIKTFGKTAENIQKFFHKGSKIGISGELEFDQWEKDGKKNSKVSVVCRLFTFIDKKDTQAPTQDGYIQPAPQPTSNIPEIDVNEDEIPF